MLLKLLQCHLLMQHAAIRSLLLLVSMLLLWRLRLVPGHVEQRLNSGITRWSKRLRRTLLLLPACCWRSILLLAVLHVGCAGR